MIILNLLIGVVVNGMAESHKEIEGDSLGPSTEGQLKTLVNEIKLMREEIQNLKCK